MTVRFRSLLAFFWLTALTFASVVHAESSITCRIVVLDIFYDNDEAEFDDDDAAHRELVCMLPNDSLGYDLDLPTEFLKDHPDIGHGESYVQITNGYPIWDPETLEPPRILILPNATITMVPSPNGDHHRQLSYGRGEHADNAIGDKTVLIVIVTTLDGSVDTTQETLSAYTFGISDDPVDYTTVKSQFRDCSYGKLNLVPAEGNGIVDGVTRISVPKNIQDVNIRGFDSYITTFTASHLGIGSLNVFDHVMFVVPWGSIFQDNKDWGGYAFVNSYRSIYNDKIMVESLSCVMHEIGHNLGLWHSGRWDDSYGDNSCTMGRSRVNQHGPRRCFNGHKNYLLGWFDDDKIAEVDVTQGAWTGTLAGLPDYDDIRPQDYMLVQVRDLFIQYNRKKDFNDGAYDIYKDRLTIVRGTQPGVDSLMIGMISLMDPENPTKYPYKHTVPNFDNGADLIIEACSKDDMSSRSPNLPDIYRISIHLDDGRQTSQCNQPATPPPTRRPTRAPTRRPTRAPTRRPTPAPTRRPTPAPTRRPTPAPTRRPTRAPTRRPTPAPTRRPTRAPTRRPTRAPTPAPAGPSGLTTLYNINVGSNGGFTDSKGTVWESDRMYNRGGTYARLSLPIDTTEEGTSDATLYRSERWGRYMSYAFPVSNGIYNVVLHFAEIYVHATEPGERVFDVLLEGTRVLSRFDIAAKVGKYKATTESFNVDITDGELNLSFAKHVENPKLSGIQIFATSPGATPSPPAPTRRPTPAPTRQPTPAPTRQPTPAPTRQPTPAPENTEMKSLTSGFDSSDMEHAGNMFNVWPLTNEPLVITGFDIHTSIEGPVLVEVYHEQESVHYESRDDLTAWNLIGRVEVGGQGKGKPTPLPAGSIEPVLVHPDELHHFYITIVTDSGEGMRSTLATSWDHAINEELVLFTGFGNAYPAGESEYGRLWNGIIHYTMEQDYVPPIAPPNSWMSSLMTTFQDSRVANGNMFRIKAMKDISVVQLAIHTRYAGAYSIEIYKRPHWYYQQEHKPDSWEKIGTANVQGKGNGFPTFLPEDTFNPVSIPAGGYYAFYVTSTTPWLDLRYSTGSSDNDYSSHPSHRWSPPWAASNSDIQITEGVGIEYPFGRVYFNRKWNGIVKYVVQ